MPLFFALVRSCCLLLLLHCGALPPLLGEGSYAACRQFGALDDLRNYAITHELYDPRESLYLLTAPSRFASDVRTIQQRYVELADAPELEDADRWPPKDCLREGMALNRAYATHLAQTLEVSPPAHPRTRWLAAAKEETERRYQIWDAMGDCRTEYYYITVRRAALKKLRSLLGYEAYYQGDFPPCVPIEYFQEGD